MIPAKVKFRRVMRGCMKGNAKGGNYLSFGTFGLQVMDRAWLTENQIEAARKVITRSLRRGGKMWIRVFPDKPVSKKPLETRMGKGKSAPDHWVAVVRPGRILFEMDGISEEEAREAVHMAGFKLPIKSRFISNVIEQRA